MFSFLMLYQVKFTTASNVFGGSCRGHSGHGHYQSAEFPVSGVSGDHIGHQAVVSVNIGSGLEYHPGHHVYYICVQVNIVVTSKFTFCRNNRI